jgi:hypothetical protein
MSEYPRPPNCVTVASHVLNVYEGRKTVPYLEFGSMHVAIFQYLMSIINQNNNDVYMKVLQMLL